MHLDSIFVVSFCLPFQMRRHYSKPRSRTNRWANMLINIFLLNIQLGHASEETMLTDLQTLATTLPGCYSNVDQYYKHAQRGLPPEKRHFLLKSEIYIMAIPMTNDSLSFYFQDFTKASTEPFRSGFYSFSVEPTMNVIRMKTFKLSNSSLAVNAFNKSDNFTLSDDVTNQVLKNVGQAVGGLRTYRACDMFWKRLGDSTFVGITGPLCLGSLGTDQVRIGVSMTLTKDKLLLTESWYKLSDGTQITEVKVPYILQRLNVQDTSNRIPRKSQINLHEIMPNDIVASDDAQASVKLKRQWATNAASSQERDDDINFAGEKTRKKDNPEKKIQHKILHKILRSFRQVATALTSGHDVYFRVELSACSIPDQVKIERVSFGGMITNFVYVRQEGLRNERKDYIYFLSHKTVMGSHGPEYISRQMTLLREGRVKVEIITTFSDPSRVKQGYAFECRLYNDQKGYGGVKLALDPARQVKRMNNFKTLSTSIDQGRDLHIVADLARCRGSRRKPAVVVGSQIINYDFVNGGKTVEIFIPFVQKLTSGQTEDNTHLQGFMGQILKNGDVILTLISNSQALHSLDNVFHLSPAYHCALSNRNTIPTNDENEHSVKFFYTK